MSVDIVKQIDFYLDNWGGDTLVQNILQEAKKTILTLRQEKAMQYLSDDYETEELHNYCEQLENRCYSLETDRNNLHLRVQELEQTFKTFERMCKEAVDGRQG